MHTHLHPPLSYPLPVLHWLSFPVYWRYVWLYVSFVGFTLLLPDLFPCYYSFILFLIFLPLLQNFFSFLGGCSLSLVFPLPLPPVPVPSLPPLIPLPVPACPSPSASVPCSFPACCFSLSPLSVYPFYSPYMSFASLRSRGMLMWWFPFSRLASV